MSSSQCAMKRATLIYIGIAGLLCLNLGLFCSGFVFPRLEQYFIRKEMALVEGSPSFDQWKKPPFPLKFKVYFFNVTNPEEVQNGSGNPVLKEMGPYIYDELRIRDVLYVNDSEDSITYMEKKFYYFNQEDSGCRSENDIISVINMGVVGTATKINALVPMALPTFSEGLPYLYPGIKNVFVAASMNGTSDGPYKIKRGLKDSDKGIIISYKNSSRLSQWNGDFCNNIRGTDLTINPSMLTIPQKVEFFAPDFCRVFSVDFVGQEMYQELESLRFATKYTYGEMVNESCFCVASSKSTESSEDGKQDSSRCSQKGTMNVEPCVKAPIVISQPHFLNADESLLEYAKGLTPNIKKHGTTIVFEPKTGITLEAKIRIQMNIGLRKFDTVTLLQNVSEGLFPVLWIDKGAQVPDWLLKYLRDSFSKLGIFVVIKYALIVTGSILISLALILTIVADKISCFHGKVKPKSKTENDQRFEGNRHTKLYFHPGINSDNVYPGATHKRNSEAWKNLE